MIETQIFANRNSRGDFIRNAITNLNGRQETVKIAVAFFTEDSVIELISQNQCRVLIVVRLGFPTNPNALQRLMKISTVQVRYFTSPSFHPKVYIFGSRAALVGSANLTAAAIQTNQEVVVGIPSGDPRFEELNDLFSEYWSRAKVLDDDTLKTYRRIYNAYAKLSADIQKMHGSVISELGHSTPSDVEVTRQAASPESAFIDEYRRSFQECVAAFNEVAEVYCRSIPRKVDESRIPLRLEIDSFVSFVRDRHAVGDSWSKPPEGWNDERRQNLRSLLTEWHGLRWPHFEDRIVGTNYPGIVRVFESARALNAASEEDIFSALTVLHSFHDRLRFFPGGLETLRERFFRDNEVARVRKSLGHLVHGEGDIVERMAQVIFDPEYKLKQFGRSNVQELVGWVNREQLPVINGRTTKILRYFGFDVVQL